MEVVFSSPSLSAGVILRACRRYEMSVLLDSSMLVYCYCHHLGGSGYSKICNTEIHSTNYPITSSCFRLKQQRGGTKKSTTTHSLPETAASILVAATVVGAAATLLAKRTKASETSEEEPVKVCEDCRGTGICAECKGEGFVLKKLSDVNAEKARLSAKNMATRYTAGLPKKWSYCTRCSSARSCSTCGGSGQLSL